MFLDSTTKSLQLVLAGAVTTNQAVISTDWADNTATTFTAGSSDLLSNNATAVTIVAAPAASTQRVVKEVSVYNADTAPITATVRLNNSGTFRTIVTVTLQTGERLAYSQTDGWRVSTVAGAIKVTAVASTVEPGYIDGCQMIRNSGTSLSVSTGSAYIPSVGANVNVNSTITKAGLALSVSTFYHVYLFLNSGVPDVEIVTTAPSSPYNGVARTKTGDTTRRYIGSVLTDSTGAVFDFVHSVEIGRISYQANISPAPFVILNGTASVATSVSCSSLVPITTRLACCPIANNDPAVTVLFGNSLTPPSAGPITFLEQVGASRTLSTELLLDASQAFQYMFLSAPSSNVVVRVKGYYYDR